MNTTIYLVRHAEVENPQKIEYMRLPGFGLSRWGRRQARMLAAFFADKDISHIYASPLLRTKETAKIIAGEDLRINYSNELLEANYKKWQGIKRSDRPQAEVDGYLKDPVKYSAILGESLVDIQKRVTRKIFEIAEKHPGRNIVVVTHAAPLIASMLFFENKSLTDFNKIIINFGCVATITLDSQLQCRSVHYNEYVSQRED